MEMELQSLRIHKLDSDNINLNNENLNLNEDLRKKRHTEGELEVMKKSMEGLTAERSNELRGVLIDSKEVKIERMLWKGGFGVVHLGLWKDEKIAVN